MLQRTILLLHSIVARPIVPSLIVIYLRGNPTFVRFDVCNVPRDKFNARARRVQYNTIKPNTSQNFNFITYRATVPRYYTRQQHRLADHCIISDRKGHKCRSHQTVPVPSRVREPQRVGFGRTARYDSWQVEERPLRSGCVFQGKAKVEPSTGAKRLRCSRRSTPLVGGYSTQIAQTEEVREGGLDLLHGRSVCGETLSRRFSRRGQQNQNRPHTHSRPGGS